MLRNATIQRFKTTTGIKLVAPPSFENFAVLNISLFSKPQDQQTAD